MRIVIVGGSGLIGSNLTERLRAAGHDVVPASRRSGVDLLTGTGLAEVMQGADVVVDVSNSPSFEPDAVLEFFETSTGHLLQAEAAAGVRHHVVLSVVGADRVPDSGYLQAKVAQERLIEGGSVPYTIVRATQFLEFLGVIGEGGLVGDTIRLPTAALQPIAADDVAAVLAEIAVEPPRNGIVDVAGPEREPMNEMVGRYLKAIGDSRPVVADGTARYFGAALHDGSLVPAGEARMGRLTLETWLSQRA